MDWEFWSEGLDEEPPAASGKFDMQEDFCLVLVFWQNQVVDFHRRSAAPGSLFSFQLDCWLEYCWNNRLLLLGLPSQWAGETSSSFLQCVVVGIVKVERRKKIVSAHKKALSYVVCGTALQFVSETDFFCSLCSCSSWQLQSTAFQQCIHYHCPNSCCLTRLFVPV